MARKTNNRDFTPILEAARTWIDSCLIDDGSAFTDGRLWTAAHTEELKRCVIDTADESDRKFLEKLRDQISSGSAGAKQLMAEMLWALSLFPSNAGPTAKREPVVQIWAMSGSALDASHPLLNDVVLQGIGSAGTAFMTQRWREIRYLITLLLDLKAKEPNERAALFKTYGALADWLQTFADTDSRQLHHMLRFFAFPDEVERIASTREKGRILKGFGLPFTKKWSQRQIDEELLKLRRRLETEHPQATLDFYNPPLDVLWDKDKNEPSPKTQSVSSVNEATPEPYSLGTADGPKNIIYFGPPGTGKTHCVRKQFKDYVETPEAKNRDAWLEALVANYGWREVIAVALNQLGPSAVPALREHELILAKARQRTTDKNLGARLWGTLQRHTPHAVKTVNFGLRAEPFIFSKDEDSTWSLLADWGTLDEEASKLGADYRAGQQSATPVKRYRTITFHPSYSYEDFVRGIRPVGTEEEGRTEFRMVDGVFKQICDEARANPTKKYALFIDEINRGNIAKIFGELITLIEPDKRITITADGSVVSGMTVQLPGSNTGEIAEPPFGVPANLDLYGTMNTADRSIALLDIALRRRFEFVEMPPRYDATIFPAPVDGVDRGALLRRINDRLEYLLDRDHRIGHAYLMQARGLADLRGAFANQIIPLLQEYFFDDLEKVAMVLSGPKGRSAFVEKIEVRHSDLFPGFQSRHAASSRNRFLVTHPETWTADDFEGIYADATAIEEESAESGS